LVEAALGFNLGACAEVWAASALAAATDAGGCDGEGEAAVREIAAPVAAASMSKGAAAVCSNTVGSGMGSATKVNRSEFK